VIFLRAIKGIELETVQKLINAECMAASTFIPIIGWGGRIAKGGEALYKTARGLEAAGQSLKAYDQASQTLKVLSTSEKGINALLAGNGVIEASTGRDMFGKPLTEEQRKNSLLQGIMMMNAFSRGKLVSNETKIAAGEQAKAFKDYVVKHVQQAKENMRNLRQNRWATAMDGVPNDSFDMADDAEAIQKTHSMANMDKNVGRREWTVTTSDQVPNVESIQSDKLKDDSKLFLKTFQPPKVVSSIISLILSLVMN
jgi:predicted ribonuclease toxin of YeeF-YezG toxin-antitoxin module